MATTTACVVGLSCIELLKLVTHKPTTTTTTEEGGEGYYDASYFRNGFMNLALPLLAFSEPNPPEEFDMPGGGGGEGSTSTYNLWSKIAVEPESDLSLGELVKDLEARLGLEVSFLSSGSTTLYSSLQPPSGQKAWMAMPVTAVVREATGKGPAAGSGGGGGGGGTTLLLQASCYDEESEEDVEVPTIAYRVVGKD